MKLPVSGFEWDAGNRTKCQQHDLSLNEIEEISTRSRKQGRRAQTHLGGPLA
jgi:uncharacterized DUF497 family protein